jgi:phage terminase Nu1 subunit (DNA packaging protein)
MSRRDGHIALRAYARHRKAAGLTGGTLRAVQEAIAEGRLSKSVVDGKIADVELADQEWSASTKADYVPLTGPAATQATATATAASPQVNALADARARREAAQAELRELELAKHRGELVPAKDLELHLARVEERMKQTFTRARNKLLAIPGRARQRDPLLTARQMATLDELIRDAVAELAEDRKD